MPVDADLLQEVNHTETIVKSGSRVRKCYGIFQAGLIPFHPIAIQILQWGALALVFPFVALILEERNLTTLEIGIVLSVNPLLQLFSGILMAFIADYTGAHKAVWCTVAVLTGIPGIFINFTENFYIIFFLWSLVSFTGGPLYGLSDGAVILYLGDRKANFGKYRLWGSLSWGVVSLTVGILYNHVPITTALYYFSGGILIYSVYLLSVDLRFMNLSKAPAEVVQEIPQNDCLTDESSVNLVSEADKPTATVHSEPTEKDLEKRNTAEELLVSSDKRSEHEIEVTKQSKLRNFLRLAFKLEVIVFYLVTIIMGMAGRSIFALSYLFLTETLHASTTLCGIATLCTIATEAPFLYFGKTFLNWFGEYWLIVFSMIAMTIRLSSYYFVTNPWFILPFQLLHAFTFGAMLVAGVSYSSKLFPPEYSTTAQGVFNAFYNGAGAALGCLVTSFMMNEFDGAYTFLCIAIAVFNTMIIFVLFKASTLYKDANSFFVRFIQPKLCRKKNLPTNDSVEMQDITNEV